jgi:hypothetical protein
VGGAVTIPQGELPERTAAAVEEAITLIQDPATPADARMRLTHRLDNLTAAVEQLAKGVGQMTDEETP